MSIAQTLGRIGANFIALVHTRAELATIELEEEALRYFSYLLLTLVAMFCFALSLLLAVLLLVVLYWDDHRIAVLLTLIILFAGCGAYVGLQIRERYRHKPHLLGTTLVELARDIDALKPSS